MFNLLLSGLSRVQKVLKYSLVIYRASDIFWAFSQIIWDNQPI